MVEIIAIDGPASVGKSTLAKKISNFYNVPCSTVDDYIAQLL